RTAPSPLERPRRARRAACRTRLRISLLLPLEHVFAKLHFVARARAGGFEDRLELRWRRWPAGHPEAALGPEHAVRAPCRLRPVDEEVHELALFELRDDLLLGHELEQRAPQLLDARTRRSGDAKDAHDPVVLDPERRRAGAAR